MQTHVRTALKRHRDENDERALHTAAGIVGQNRFAATEEINKFLAEALYRLGRGLFIVTSSAEVLFTNRVAEALLGNGLHLRQRQLAARDRAQGEALRHLIRDAAQHNRPGGIIVTQKEAAPLLLTIIPVSVGTCTAADGHAEAMIVTKDLNPACRRLDAVSRHYCLTPAETLVAAELLVGDGIAGAARRLDISEATARTHRIRIFQKMGVGRQAQLVRLLLESSDAALSGAQTYMASESSVQR